MLRPQLSRLFLVFTVLLLFAGSAFAAETFRIATYNVENYLDTPTTTRNAKPVESKAKVCEAILFMHPDILALEEMGSASALDQLQASLKERGLELPNCERVSGSDTNIHIVVLSRFPFKARHPHTDETFLLGGRRFRVSRGFAEVDVQVNKNYSFTLLAAHLKSRRQSVAADESELRLEEAKILRELIDARLKSNPALNLVVLGHFNDTKDSASTRAIISRGKLKLIDTRPAANKADT